ncbi:hypothetical protein FA13DRAFT_953745 [Coprinellus micaceus]|uniref:Uncharacterized protein n=1 Tax=Coprinellus micaceus TaxID=71717 RepID=A0A4Y7RYA5_COPMI|nr:hypothetical protein FA13DRAFT_953745 [Coprinellus micaceus]
MRGLVSIYLERRRGGKRMKGEEDRGEGEGEEEGMREEGRGKRRRERERRKGGRKAKDVRMDRPRRARTPQTRRITPHVPGDAVLEYGCGAKFGSSGIVKLKLNWDPVFCCAKWETG